MEGKVRKKDETVSRLKVKKGSVSELDCILEGSGSNTCPSCQSTGRDEGKKLKQR